MSLRGNSAPRRRASDTHVHLEYWTEDDQRRYELGQEKQLDGIRAELRSINTRLTMLLGAIGLIAFLLPIAAPFLRQLVGVEVPTTP